MNNIYDKKPLPFIPFFILLSIYMLVIFGLKDFLILLFSDYPHLYSVVEIDAISFEEFYIYFPATGNFDLGYLPELTILINWILYKVLFFSSIDLYLLFSHTIIPLASFWLLVFIYLRYLSMSWSVLLAFFGVTFFFDFSLFAYLADITNSLDNVVGSASLRPPEITRSPIPSFTFFIFALTYYVTTISHRVSDRRLMLYTLLWSLNIYIYLHNFIAGITFWFFYLIYASYLKQREFDKGALAKLLLYNLGVVLVILLPFAVSTSLLMVNAEVDVFQNYGLVEREAGPVVDKWGVFFSYLMPILLTAVIIRVYCRDFYELFYKFTPIFILIGVELLVLNLHIIFGSFFQSNLYNIRIGNFFPKYLYYVPVIYFLASPLKTLFHTDSINKVAIGIHEFFGNYLLKYRYIVVSVGIGIVSILVISSNIKAFNHNVSKTSPRMNEVVQKYEELESIKAGGGIIVSEYIPVNMLLQTLRNENALFINSFGNPGKTDEIIERMALFARIFQWDEMQYLKFMMPGVGFKEMYAKNNFVISDETLKNGFGYWLTWHRRKMDGAQLSDYKALILKKFRGLDVMQFLAKYSVKAIQFGNSIDPSIRVKSVSGENKTKMVLVDY